MLTPEVMDIEYYTWADAQVRAAVAEILHMLWNSRNMHKIRESKAYVLYVNICNMYPAQRRAIRMIARDNFLYPSKYHNYKYK